MPETPRIEELRRRVQMDPASIAFAALAEEYRKQGRFEEAIETCTAGLQRHPAYLSAHVTLGRALIEVGRYDEAKEELDHVLRVAPENLAAIRGLADIHHRRGELPESHGPFEPAATPTNPQRPAPDAQRPAGADHPMASAASGAAADAAPAGMVDPAPSPAAPVLPERDPVLDDLETFLDAIVAARIDRPASR